MKNQTRSMVLTAFFVALILLLGMTPMGLIPLGFVNVTILCVPVIVGTLILGLKTGVLLGLCFGVVSALSAFGLTLTAPSALASALLAANPFLAVALCVVPRALVPVATWLVYAAASRGKKYSPGAAAAGAVAGSITNTVFYLGLMLLFYTAAGLDAAAIRALVGGIGLIAGGAEALTAALLATPIARALWKNDMMKDAGEQNR